MRSLPLTPCQVNHQLCKVNMHVHEHAAYHCEHGQMSKDCSVGVKLVLLPKMMLPMECPSTIQVPAEVASWAKRLARNGVVPVKPIRPRCVGNYSVYSM